MSHGTSPLSLVHKKIRLSEDLLSWEHERFSLKRLPAATLSSFHHHKDPRRHSMFINRSMELLFCPSHFLMCRSHIEIDIFALSLCPSHFSMCKTHINMHCHFVCPISRCARPISTCIVTLSAPFLDVQDPYQHALSLCLPHFSMCKTHINMHCHFVCPISQCARPISTCIVILSIPFLNVQDPYQHALSFYFSMYRSHIDVDTLTKSVHALADGIAHYVYNLSSVVGSTGEGGGGGGEDDVFSHVSSEYLVSWMEFLASQARSPQLLTEDHPVVSGLHQVCVCVCVCVYELEGGSVCVTVCMSLSLSFYPQALSRYLQDVTKLIQRPDRRCIALCI